MGDRTPIFQSLAMIEERIREKLTVTALAESAHFSKYHYQRMFREAVGDSVMGYVARRRLSYAASDLASTEDSVLEIALRYGYDSHEGFTRSFKAYMGVTPTEYRKFRLSVTPQKIREEKTIMMYSKTTDEIIRELNSLIVEARETAADTRKKGGMGPEAAFYGEFWEFAASRAEEMAGQLTKMLEQVAAIARRPDEISARFLIIKAVEDAAFASSVTAFQIGLMIARAMPEHRQAYQPLCRKYDALAQHAWGKAEKITHFLQELAELIFQDMRQNATKRIEAAREAGRAAAERLGDPALPYGYMAEEITNLEKRLSNMALSEVTVTMLEDLQFRLDTISFAAQMDTLREPSHRELFDGIARFRERLDDATDFFRSLWEESVQTPGKTQEKPEKDWKIQKMCSDLAMQEGILLFWLKGEVQKLGTHLEEEQRGALTGVCQKLEQAVTLSESIGDKRAETVGETEIAGTDRAEVGKIVHLLQEVYQELTVQAKRLGIYGGALSYMAEEIRRPLGHLPE